MKTSTEGENALEMAGTIPERICREYNNYTLWKLLQNNTFLCCKEGTICWFLAA